MDGGWWEPDFSWLEREIKGKRRGKVGMNAVGQTRKHLYEFMLSVMWTQVDGCRDNYRYVCIHGLCLLRGARSNDPLVETSIPSQIFIFNTIVQ